MSITGSIKKREYKRDGKVIRTRYRARYLDPAKPGANAKIEQTFRREADAKEWLVHQAATIQEGTHIDPREATTPLRKVVEDWRGTWDRRPLAAKTQAGSPASSRNTSCPGGAMCRWEP